MTKNRLDKRLFADKIAQSRSQAENFIRMGEVSVDGEIITKAGYMVDDRARVTRKSDAGTYVSRAGLKLASVAHKFNLDFEQKIVLDIGSSTGGFTDYALQNGAKKVFAVDVGTNQLHPTLRTDSRIELHEKTDIRDFFTDTPIDIIVGDVSFISLREILPHVAKNLMQNHTQLVAMVKPQFEAGRNQVNKGVIKNNAIRRAILSDFEQWSRNYFMVSDKRDSDVAGAKGNLERFYLLQRLK